MLERIDDEVDRLVREFGTTDPFKLMKELHIKLKWNILPERILGYSTLADRISMVTLNQIIADTPSAYSVAGHELGHGIFHRGINTKFFSRNATKAMADSYENEANIFMFKLLFHKIDRRIYLSNPEAVLKYYGLPSWMSLYFDMI